MPENPLNKSTEENGSAAPSTIEVGKIEVAGDVRGDITVGHGNIIHRITNYFLGDTKGQLEQRNRRVMLDHVENFWVRGVLEKSLHGATLLELGIKEDPGAISYPWTVKREATDEALPAGKSMLEIFQEIGLGRSLLILGAPGSGKTTMLLELARGLIGQARGDAIEPIPVVFNLASWKESQSLGDWLAEQLNLVYYVPRKIAPSWVAGNKHAAAPGRPGRSERGSPREVRRGHQPLPQGQRLHLPRRLQSQRGIWGAQDQTFAGRGDQPSTPDLGSGRRRISTALGRAWRA